MPSLGVLSVLRGGVLVLCCAVVPVSAADKKTDKKPSPATQDNYAEIFAKYLAEARRQAQSAPVEPNRWMNSLMTDSRARYVNDLLTVRVEENITASGSADSSLSKDSSAGIGVPNIFGLEKKLPSAIDPTNLANAKASTKFKGSGSTTRNGLLTTTLTARVAEVLPNGDLVVEGVHEIEINGDRQIVVLSGVARLADVGAGNVVSSTSLGQLSIRYYGRGLMKDSLSPGWLVRVLNKIF
jgi:flagellar L-ring protein precursor FlgH